MQAKKNIGIFSSHQFAAHFTHLKGKVVIKPGRNNHTRPSGHGDTYLPYFYADYIAPKALSTWSS